MISGRDLTKPIIIVQIELHKTKGVNFTDKLSEFKNLVLSTGVVNLKEVTGKQARPVAGTFIRKGKALYIKKIVEDLKSNLVIFNHELTPSQERNLESIFDARVLDRTGLILDIFAIRANSHVGKLQVELAQLTHLSTRLIRGWSHLERQRGGIGLRGGPGEKQLETDRRLIGQRIKSIQKRLNKVHKQKSINRYSRKKSQNKLVALVGYTNSGKTTLFNILTGANELVANKPFATLDSITRRNATPELERILFSDTVGFISDLPTHLVESFKTTLDELNAADLLIHVVDISDPSHLEKIETVNQLLDELNLTQIPQIRVNNKVDKLSQGFYKKSTRQNPKEVWISAKHNSGIESLKESLNKFIYEGIFKGWITLESSLGKIRSRLYSLGRVIEERTTEKGLIQLHLNVGNQELKKLTSQKGIDIIEK